MRIVWTAAALRDLAALRDFTTGDNPQAANRQAALVVSAVAGLAEFPQAGMPGRRQDTRELVVGSTPYLVPYRVQGAVAQVLRVLHGRQRWPGSL